MVTVQICKCHTIWFTTSCLVQALKTTLTPHILTAHHCRMRWNRSGTVQLGGAWEHSQQRRVILRSAILLMSQLCPPRDNHWRPRNPNCATKKAGCHGGGYQGIPFNVPHVCRPREKQLAAANWSQKSKTTAEDEFNRIDSSAHTLQESAMYRKKYSSSLTYHVLW